MNPIGNCVKFLSLAIKFQLFSSETLIRFDCGCDVLRMYCYKPQNSYIPQKKGVF
jgi:hypothetical protein